MGFIIRGGGGTGTGGTTDHNALVNKTLPNQHTIDAITGLLDELGKRPQTADVNTMINSIIDGAPEAYNTLKEIADYIEQDQSAGASILATLGNKVDKEAGKGLSSNDYDNTAKNKVDNLNITQVIDLDAVKNASHTHANSGVLGKIGEDENGNIIYNNNHVNDKLANARTIGITGKVIGTATSFDGSANITINTTAVTADNSDTVDGKHATDFAPAGYGLGGRATVLSSVDLNTVYDSGFYWVGADCTNQPIASMSFHLIVQGGRYNGTTPQYFSQIATHYNTGGTYTRTCLNGTWSAWKKLAITDDITASGANFSFKTDNAYSFGTSDKRATQLYAATATINTSDRNAKKDITETQLGLDFINKLKPVEYKYKVRQNVVEQIQDGTQTIEIAPAETNENGKVIKKAKLQEIPVYKEVVTSLPGVRTHLGLIAQEVEECLGGRDLAIVTKDENGYGLRYEELIAPLIKAVQELSAEVVELRNNNVTGCTNSNCPNSRPLPEDLP